MADRGFWHRIAAAVRIKTLPLSIGSVLVVVADAAGRDLPVQAWRVAAALVIAASLHAAGILVSDVFDHRAGTDKLARLDKTAVPTGALQLEDRSLRVRDVATVAAVLGLLATALVASFREASVWPWFLAGIACVWSYAAPPLRIAYIGGGFGELVLAAAYGPLLGVATAHALQVPRTGSMLLGSSILGALVAMTFCTHHLLHWRADRAATKRTPAVVYGEDGALLLIGLVDLAVFIAILVGVALQTLPPVAAVALLGAPGVAVALRRAHEDPVAQRILGAIGAHLAAVVFAIVGLVAGLALR